MNSPTYYLQAEFESLVPPPLPVDRRGFLVTALGAGFALAAQPVMAQTAITTDGEGLTAGEIQVPTADGGMPAYRAHPAHVAKLGYQAIAPELYARQGDPRQYTAIPDILAKVVSKVPDSQVMADLDACVAWARANGGDSGRLGITGFCWGGRIAWLYAAHNPGVKAGVAWYGRLTSPASEMTPRHPLDLAGELKGPVLGLYGGQDGGIPNDTVEKMRKALAESANPASKASAIHLNPNAPHAFHADYRPSYRKEEAEDGWKRMREWFTKHGV